MKLKRLYEDKDEKVFWTEFEKDKFDKYLKIKEDYDNVSKYIENRLEEIIKHYHKHELDEHTGTNIDDFYLGKIEIYNKQLFLVEVYDSSKTQYDNFCGEVDIAFEEFEDPELFHETKRFGL